MLIAALKAWKHLSIYALSYLIIIPMFKNQFFVILSIFSEMYWTNMFKNLIKIFSAKICILPKNAYTCIHFYLSVLLFATYLVNTFTV